MGKRKKCNKCEFFEWEDECPECVFGINNIEDLDKFENIHIHPKARCYQPEIEVRIKFNGAYCGDDIKTRLKNLMWLCPENVELALKEVCRNSDFKVSYTKRFERKIKRMLKHHKMDEEI